MFIWLTDVQPPSTYPVVVDRLVGVQNNIVPLALGEFQTRGSVGLDGNEISGNDFQLVLVNAELKHTIDSRIDQAKAVLLALLNHSCQLDSSSGTIRVSC